MQQSVASIANLYGGTIRRELQRHPVWEPGETIVAGSWGVFGSGCFKARGRVQDWGIAVATTSTPRLPWEFLGSGVEKLASEGKGSLLPFAKGDLSVAFSQAGAVAVVASASWVETIPNVAEVARQVKLVEHWPMRAHLVVSVRHVSGAALAVSSLPDGEIKFSGTADYLPVPHAGVASGAGSIGAQWVRGNGYWRERLKGALLLDIVTIWNPRAVLSGLGALPDDDSPPPEYVHVPTEVAPPDDDAA